MVVRIYYLCRSSAESICTNFHGKAIFASDYLKSISIASHICLSNSIPSLSSAVSTIDATIVVTPA